jgi:hypothetical protein
VKQVIFEEKYPYIGAWVKEMGPIGIGYLYDAPDASFLRVIQYTDLIWSSEKHFASLDNAFAEMEEAIATWCDEQGIPLVNG